MVSDMNNLVRLQSDIYRELYDKLYTDVFHDIDESDGMLYENRLTIPEPILLSDVLRWFGVRNSNKNISFITTAYGFAPFAILGNDE